MAETQPSIEERISASMAPEAAEPLPLAAVELPPEDIVSEAPEAPEQVEPEQFEPEALATDDTPDDTLDAVTPESEEEAVQLTSLHELAEHLGVEQADLYQLQIPITDPNGERREVSLGEWKDTFQNNQRAERLAQEASELKTQLQEQQMQVSEAMERQAQEGAAFLSQVESTLQQEFQSINWDSLRVNNPTEWTAKRQEFQERNGHLQNMRQQAASAYDQQKAAHSKQNQEQLAEVTEREHRLMVAAVPDWADDSKRDAETAKLRDYLLNTGYSQTEVDNVYDHRNIVLARKAMMFDAMSKSGNAAKKKVLKLGSKVLTPGAKRSKVQAQAGAESALRKSLKKSGSVDDATALIQHRLTNRR